MRNLLALVGFVVVLFAGLGWYLGWYNFSFKPDTEGKVNIQGSIDAKKITEDAKKAGETVGKALQNFSQNNGSNSTNRDLMGPPLPPDMPQATPPTTGHRPGIVSGNLPFGR